MRISLEPEQNFSTFLAARLIFVTVLLGLAALFRASPSGIAIYVALFAANAVLSVGCWEWSRRRRLVSEIQWLALTGAVVLDTLVLHVVGGVEREFVFLYFFSIASAGILIGLVGSLWTAAASAVGVLILLHSQSVEFVAEHLVRVFLYTINFFLTAILTSFVHERLRQSERRHQHALGELRQAKLDTQAILDCLDTGVLILDRQGVVLYSNPAVHAILGIGLPNEQDAFATVLKAGHPLDLAIQGLTSRTAGRTAEIQLPKASGSVPIGLTVSNLHDSAGDPRGIIVLLADLTSQKEAECAARVRDRLAAVGFLSQDLAHEIRNPLATVRGSVEMMRLDGALSGDMKPYLDLALRESDRLNVLLRDFLRFAHLEMPKKRVGDLAHLVRERAAKQANRIEWVDELPAQMMKEFDSDQLTLVIDAILLSLAEWSEDEPPALIKSLCAPPDGLRFLLEGRAISPQWRENAFRPFSEVSRAHSGLALPTALRAIHGHGGSLTLFSEPSIGTWFELTVR